MAKAAEARKAAHQAEQGQQQLLQGEGVNPAALMQVSRHAEVNLHLTSSMRDPFIRPVLRVSDPSSVVLTLA